MKFKKINNTGIQIGLYILFTVSALEIIIYFFYIYKPASQIFDSNNFHPLEIPSMSQILKPSQLTDNSISLADTQKTIFPEKLEAFKTFLDAKLSTQNTFVKDSSMSVIISGVVANINKATDKSITITLKNSSGIEATEYFSVEDLKRARVSLTTLSLTAPSRVDSTLESAKSGDTLIIKLSSSLTDKSYPFQTEIEIYRYADTK